LFNQHRAICALTLFLAALAFAAPPASAVDKVRAGKTTSDTWPYAALDIGVGEGIFAKYGLDVEVTALSGGARFQQALASNSIDVGVSGTAAMAQTAKRSPVIAVAATVGAPRGFSLVVAQDSPIKTVPDLNQAAFARKNLVAEDPDLVNRFLKGLFATVAFMKHNRAKTIELTAKIFNQSPG
jgi:ABC-type nitrate/sulfonate/bicarbonate transport system substrate-binding protein